MHTDPDSTHKPVLGTTESVCVIGQHERTEVDARIDTGATRTAIDLSLACSIGAGRVIEQRTFRSGTGDRETRPIIELTIRVRGCEHHVQASATDRSELSTDLRLGRDILDAYLVDVSR